MKDTKKQKNLILLLTIILIFTIIWVASNVYHNFVNSTITIPLADEIIPIEGTFDTQAIEQIKSRTRVEPVNDIITLSEDIQSEEETATPTAQLDLEEELENGTDSAEIEL